MRRLLALNTYNVAIECGHFNAIHNDVTYIDISLVIYREYIMTLYHAGDVIYDIKNNV